MTAIRLFSLNQWPTIPTFRIWRVWAETITWVGLWGSKEANKGGRRKEEAIRNWRQGTGKTMGWEGEDDRVKQRGGHSTHFKDSCFGPAKPPWIESLWVGAARQWMHMVDGYGMFSHQQRAKVAEWPWFWGFSLLLWSQLCLDPNWSPEHVAVVYASFLEQMGPYIYIYMYIHMYICLSVSKLSIFSPLSSVDRLSAVFMFLLFYLPKPSPPVFDQTFYREIGNWLLITCPPDC